VHQGAKGEMRRAVLAAYEDNLFLSFGYSFCSRLCACPRIA
jgi:hypothetical protein